ncbi:disintegrin and metalloproteinase domain-containing protein 17-like, partial [Mizuhopecten yessoensis]|uniref:disintegrin and metalloproteinase domain-containing protein 17-like n=1 Tax=Mizuhopecten yessoensis TaxID=6573 RepID=UPI000B457F72
RKGGTHSNNVLFSPCSRRSIYKVLEGKGSDCLKEKNPYLAFCGNGRLDSGEECDSGTRPDDCCTDKCVLTAGSDCSPFNKACCSQCKLAQAGTICLQMVDDNFDCKGNAQCNGFQYDCPPPSKKPDNTSCQDVGKCIDGNCVGFCQQMGMIPCVCSPESGLACYRCCKPTSDSKCVSFSELLDNGRTCYQGYCQTGVCIKSPSKINKFWNALGSQVIDSFDVFMRDNIVFFITLFSLILWLPAVLIFEYFEKKQSRQDDMLINRQVNRRMRGKVDILPEGEKESSILHVGSLSVSGARSSRPRHTLHRTFTEPQQEYAGNSSQIVKSGSQPLYTDYQKVSTLPQGWKPGGYDRKAQRIPLTVDNLSDQRGYRKDASSQNQTRDPKLQHLSVDNLSDQRGYRTNASSQNQTRDPKLQHLSVDNLSDQRGYRKDVSSQNYEGDPVSQPRKYPSHLELGRGATTLPYSIRRPIERYPGYDTGSYNNKASTLPLPSRGFSYSTEQKPSNIDTYTVDNEPMPHAGYPLSNKLPLTIKPTSRGMYHTNNGHLQEPLPIEDDGQYFKPISHRSSDTDYESTPRSAQRSYYYHENPYEEPENVSRKYAPGGQGQTIGYGKMPTHYGPSFSSENLSQNSPRQPISNEHLPASHGGHHNNDRFMNLGYEGDSMTVTETMI